MCTFLCEHVFIFLGFMPRRGIDVNMVGNLMFNYLWN